MATAKKTYARERNYQKVGAFLRAARLRCGLSQRDVSMAIGYANAQHISNFECGIDLPPLKKLANLVVLYKLNASSLVDLVLTTERERMMDEIRARAKRR